MEPLCAPAYRFSCLDRPPMSSPVFFRVRSVYAAYFFTGKKGCLPYSESSRDLPEMGGKDKGYDKDHDKSGGFFVRFIVTLVVFKWTASNFHPHLHGNCPAQLTYTKRDVSALKQLPSTSQPPSTNIRQHQQMTSTNIKHKNLNWLVVWNIFHFPMYWE